MPCLAFRLSKVSQPRESNGVQSKRVWARVVGVDRRVVIEGVEVDEDVTVSLALLNDMTLDMMGRLMEGIRSDLILIPCRAAKLNWPTVESILRNRPVPYPIDELTLEVAQRDYRKLSLETAQRTVRFWQLHNRIEK